MLTQGREVGRGGTSKLVKVRLKSASKMSECAEVIGEK